MTPPGKLVEDGARTLSPNEITCTKPGCLATYSWFGHPADPLLASLAKERGWIVLESQGWICPHHKSHPQPGETRNADPA